MASVYSELTVVAVVLYRGFSGAVCTGVVCFGVVIAVLLWFEGHRLFGKVEVRCVGEDHGYDRRCQCSDRIAV